MRTFARRHGQLNLSPEIHQTRTKKLYNTDSNLGNNIKLHITDRSPNPKNLNIATEDIKFEHQRLFLKNSEKINLEAIRGSSEANKSESPSKNRKTEVDTVNYMSTTGGGWNTGMSTTNRFGNRHVHSFGGVSNTERDENPNTNNNTKINSNLQTNQNKNNLYTNNSRSNLRAGIFYSSPDKVPQQTDNNSSVKYIDKMKDYGIGNYLSTTGRYTKNRENKKVETEYNNDYIRNMSNDYFNKYGKDE